MNEYQWRDLREGLSHEFEAELTQSMVDDFIRLSGDQNPLHTDIEFAKHAGFPSTVAHGLLTSALYSRLVGCYLPGRYCFLHGIDLDFVKPAFVGDRLRVSGAVIHLNEAYRRVEIRATIHNNRGDLISRAKIRVGLHER